MGKQVISVDHILEAAQSNSKTLNFKSHDCIITPGARDKIDELGIRFLDAPAASRTKSCAAFPSTANCGVVAQVNPEAQGNLSNVENITAHICTLLENQLPESGTPDIASLVKKVVEAKLAGITAVQTCEYEGALSVCGDVALIHGDRVFAETNTIDIPGKVSISEAIRCHADSPHATTYMQWKKSSFTRTLETTEIDLIVEGELDVTINGKTLSAQAGDVLYINKGANVAYSTATSVKLACVNI